MEIENNKLYSSFRLKLMSLGISLFSSFCVLTNSNLLNCCNIVGVKCIIDFCFKIKNDMLIHHMLVLFMLHYVNTHNGENRNEIISVVLSTEISTIFLTTNNLLKDTASNLDYNLDYVKNANKVIFVYSFVYYRVYNYAYYLIFNKNIHNTFLIHSKNMFELCEVYTSVYGLFILNLYWTSIIIKKIFVEFLKSVKCADKTQNVKNSMTT